MPKTIDTLIEDVYEVIDGKGGWDATVTEYLAQRMSSTLGSKFERPKRRIVILWMSNFGKQCKRQL